MLAHQTHGLISASSELLSPPKYRFINALNLWFMTLLQKAHVILFRSFKLKDKEMHADVSAEMRRDILPFL